MKTAFLKNREDHWGDQLFEAMADVPSAAILMSIPIVLAQQSPLPLKTSVDKMVQEYFASFFSNRPRQRRKLCNWMSEWATLPLQLQDMMPLASKVGILSFSAISSTFNRRQQVSESSIGSFWAWLSSDLWVPARSYWRVSSLTSTIRTSFRSFFGTALLFIAL